MAARSSILAWGIPRTEEPGGLQSMGVTKSRTGHSDSIRTTKERVHGKGDGCTHKKKPQVKVKVKSLSRVRLFATPWTVAYQAPRSMGFSRQEY